MLGATKSLTEQSIDEVQSHIHYEWVKTYQESFVQKHILARGAHLLLVPASLITTAIDTIVGLGAGIGAILTLGQNKNAFCFAVTEVLEANRLLILPYQNFLQAINPEAEFTDHIKAEDGPITNNVMDPLLLLARNCANSKDFLTRHVASRLTYALTALACLVTRTVDGIISIPVTAASIVTLGRFRFINDLACKTLKVGALISFTFVIFPVLIINPHINETS
jgi:hypothetical protein